MTQFYAQPYDISATGFYFETAEEYAEKASKAKNEYGQKVEEFEIQFIDGEMIDAQTCEALGINQGNIQKVIELLDEWDDDQKRTIRVTSAPVRFMPLCRSMIGSRICLAGGGRSTSYSLFESDSRHFE